MSDKQIFEIEKARGEAYKRAYEQYIEPFFTEKTAQLFEAFKDTQSSNSDDLLRIKLQLNALEGLKAHFDYYIETGRMAELSLDKIEEGENNGY